MGMEIDTEQYRGTISVRGVAVSVGYTVWLLVTSALEDVRTRLFTA